MRFSISVPNLLCTVDIRRVDYLQVGRLFIFEIRRNEMLEICSWFDFHYSVRFHIFVNSLRYSNNFNFVPTREQTLQIITQRHP